MGTPCPTLAALVAAEVMEQAVIRGRPSASASAEQSLQTTCERQQCGAPGGDPSAAMEIEHEMESPVKENDRREENFKDKCKRIWDLFLAA